MKTYKGNPFDKPQNGNDFIVDVRLSALDWFNRLTLEEQFYKTIEHNGLIAGDNTRHPSTLTGREIETIYLADA
jgi:hypothetical protein